MNKRILIALALFILVGASAVAYAVLRPPAEASQDISAIPLTTDTPALLAESTVVAEPTANAALPTATTQASSTLLLQIDPAKSSVRFIIDEILAGSPKTVIGETDQLGGQIEVNLANPSASRVGTIQVNARTLTTDNNFRNRAIKNQILMTDANEFVTFTPTGLSGMPASVAVGDTFSFQVTGDLTIREITQSVTFDVEVTAVSSTSLSGTAFAVIQRADYKLIIPQVPNVAGVSEDVRLEIDFTASQ